MSQTGEILIGLVVLIGALISALSAFGLVRLPDVYLRSHAATKSATLGVLFILAGVFLYFAFYLEHVSAKLLLGIVFVFITAPVAGHLNGRAAYRSGVPLWERSVQDDWSVSIKKEREKQ
ncbi:monovalent cation/H(+) antiporter subunit G [Paenibacillus alkaliterrae]|uniref:monovalent cation/H(+) antiporter subunit G n=1 Tax=Paenibacillus alkaliterrae TaxID=320909 RepID=UPI001F45B141|nr:monovalent cation/H(+) antiporter subunit G [Paenibacillus alkaliterrae]MCF2939903.1 monovalent cation/H(+) antiporter subunit G [Paenibacillus alkaliterrae]